MAKLDSDSDKIISKFKVIPESKDTEKNNGVQSGVGKMAE